MFDIAKWFYWGGKHLNRFNQFCLYLFNDKYILFIQHTSNTLSVEFLLYCWYLYLSYCIFTLISCEIMSSEWIDKNIKLSNLKKNMTTKLEKKFPFSIFHKLIISHFSWEATHLKVSWWRDVKDLVPCPKCV